MMCLFFMLGHKFFLLFVRRERQPAACVPSLIKYPTEPRRKTNDIKWLDLIVSLRLAAYIWTWLLREKNSAEKKMNTHQDNIHFLVLQSLQFKFTASLLCAVHLSVFMYQSFQSASTLTSELTMGTGDRPSKIHFTYIFLSFTVMI